MESFCKSRHSAFFSQLSIYEPTARRLADLITSQDAVGERSCNFEAMVLNLSPRRLLAWDGEWIFRNINSRDITAIAKLFHLSISAVLCEIPRVSPLDRVVDVQNFLAAICCFQDRCAQHFRKLPKDDQHIWKLLEKANPHCVSNKLLTSKTGIAILAPFGILDNLYLHYLP
jgi:hypothetical protein